MSIPAPCKGWAETQAALPETRLVYVANREGDIYELFAEAEKCGPERAELLIRANQNRCLTDGRKLWEKAAAAPVLGQLTFTMPATKTRAAREVTQTLRAASVALKAPQGKGKGAPAVHRPPCSLANKPHRRVWRPSSGCC